MALVHLLPPVTVDNSTQLGIIDRIINWVLTGLKIWVLAPYVQYAEGEKGILGKNILK